MEKLVSLSMKASKRNLLRLYPFYDKVLGPYTRSDGRKQIILVRSSLPGKDPRRGRTVSFPKALVECHIGKRLKINETIDHYDGNCFNNSIKNLKILSLSDNAKKAAVRNEVPKTKCQWCSTIFVPKRSQFNERSKAKAGPFCSKSCSGKYGAAVQNGLSVMKRKEVKIKKYTLNFKGVKRYVGA